MGKIMLLDCTLRDGAYITESNFGTPVIRGLISKLQDAHVDIIECGWLKNADHKDGSSFFHIPSDIEPYHTDKSSKILYCAMIDWDRYDTDVLPQNNGKGIDAVRVVFPHGKHREGIEVGRRIKEKGYQVLFQAANTLAYSDDELVELARDMNEFKPVSLSVVDTFGAMFFDDLDRITKILNDNLDEEISIGFHSHNNQQLAFALSIHFVESMKDKRTIIVDATLSGMGRGAGNATTELVASYLNRKQHGSYDMNAIMDAIDTYMQRFHEEYTWGYSTAYFIAGLYQCHVNNIAYLLTNHRTNARDMRNVIESLSAEERRKYDYDLLEQKFLENQSRIVDDDAVISSLRDTVKDRKVLLLAPGKTASVEYEKIRKFIKEENPVVIEVNAVNKLYDCDYIFFTNTVRYEYAKGAYPETFGGMRKILLSCIKTNAEDGEMVINYNLVIKRGWEHFDNSMILCLRLMKKLNATDVYIAGFDGFKTKYNESYADENLPTLNPDNKWEELNEEIKEMYREFHDSVVGSMSISFLTESIYEIQ